MEKAGREVGLHRVGPPMGLFPVQDSFGMGVAIAILKRSLDPGRNEKTIQFLTTRRI